jgi:hypothetical protein
MKGSKMHDQTSKYDGPALSIVINKSDSASFSWEIQMLMANHKKTTFLGYRASGVQNGLNATLGLFDIDVHDENREVWTPMPKDQRPDIRSIFENLLTEAFANLRKGLHC